MSTEYAVYHIRNDIASTVTPYPPGDLPQDNDVREWLEKQAAQYGLETVLAHAIDGVVWGAFDASGKLMTSYEVEGLQGGAVYSAELRDATLQEARLFRKNAELYLWRSDASWYARLIKDQPGAGTEYIDDVHLLWGDQAKVLGVTGFTVMSDGVQGLRHVTPIPVPQPTTGQARPSNSAQYAVCPLRLVVRHYLADEQFARIAFSRLVKLEII